MADGKKGYEVLDLSLRGIVVTIVVLAGLLLAVLGGMRGFLGILSGSGPGGDDEARPFETPLPHLQVAPVQDLAALRASEDSLLAGYAWVDPDSGIVRIPIERAMENLLEKGLPVRPDGPLEGATP
jgi:hypothetical protein